VLSKVAPSSKYHIEDVNRAGGVMGIMNELNKGGLLNPDVIRVEGKKLDEVLKSLDITVREPEEAAQSIYSAAPGNVINTELASQQARYEELDVDREKGCIRDIEHAYEQDGGLAVLFGNIARKGCIVKTAGVDSSVLRFTGRARVYHSQDEACDAILNDQVVPGDVVLILYEGPSGGPGMQEMLYPTSYIKSKKLDKECALITDGRFSGGTSGLSIGHVSPEAAAGGEIALLRDGDSIEIDIPGRIIHARLSDEELQERRKKEEQHQDKAYSPRNRNRKVSKALQIYSKVVSSADQGAVRIL
jgi:dihydroxy-acid dehydratase